MSLTKITNSMIQGAAVNVKDYGATGLFGGNDTIAIQAAINAAAVQGFDIYFPPGKYVVNDTLTIPIHGAGTPGEQHGTGKMYGAGRNEFSPEGAGTSAFWGTEIIATGLGGKPLFYATQSRYVQIEDMQIFGPGLAVASSIGLHLDNQNSQWSLINVGMQDFYTLIQLGQSGMTTHFNDDFGTMDRCVFDYATYFMRAYTTETFQTRILNSIVGNNVQVGYVGEYDGAGTSAGSLRAWSTYFGCWDIVISMNIECRDGVHLTGCQFETGYVGLTQPPTLFQLDSVTGFFQSPITVENSFINYNLGAAYGNATKPLIKVLGKGPVSFRNNKIEHANPYVLIEANTPDNCSATFEGNIWQYAPIYRKISDTTTAEIISRNELVSFAGYTGTTDSGTTPANYVGTCGRTSYAGKTIQFDDIAPGGSVLAGSIIYGSAPSSAAPAIRTAIYAGTNGTLAGVTGGISVGTSVLTVNTSVGLYPGAYIDIVGVTSPLDGFRVTSLWNNVVQLSSTANATVAAAAVTYHAPLYRNIVIYAGAAPTTGTWVKGDIAYNANPASAGYIGWVCTVAGTSGTWKTFGLIS